MDFRLGKRLETELLKITFPAHKPVKKSTLSKIIKQAKLDLETFLKLV